MRVQANGGQGCSVLDETATAGEMETVLKERLNPDPTNHRVNIINELMQGFEP